MTSSCRRLTLLVSSRPNPPSPHSLPATSTTTTTPLPTPVTLPSLSRFPPPSSFLSIDKFVANGLPRENLQQKKCLTLQSSDLVFKADESPLPNPPLQHTSLLKVRLNDFKVFFLKAPISATCTLDNRLTNVRNKTIRSVTWNTCTSYIQNESLCFFGCYVPFKLPV